MIEATLLQRLDGNDEGTFGRLSMLGKSFFSLELPDRGNAPGISCIPEGVYTVRWTLSPRLKRYTYEIMGVPGRAGIRIHSGNFAGAKPMFLTHSLGCPLLGYKIGRMHNQKAILDSRRAVADFERLGNKETIRLEVRNV